MEPLASAEHCTLGTAGLEYADAHHRQSKQNIIITTRKDTSAAAMKGMLASGWRFEGGGGDVSRVPPVPVV